MKISCSCMRRTAALLLACLLLLSGCGQGAQSGSLGPTGDMRPSGEPGPALPVDTPAPAEDTASPEVSVSAALTPAPSPSPTPEPTQEVKELWGFPIDDTHDAFEVPTGGRLGTVLVTVERKTEDENTEYTSIFSVWDTSDLTEPIQTMVQEGVTTHTHKLLDANFDDCMDFCYTQYKGAKNEDYCLYIWDEEQGKFSFVESFLGSPGTNSKNKTFDNWSSGSIASGIHEIYRWEDNELVCVRRVEMDYTAEHGDELVVRDLVNGEMVEVFRKYCPLGSSMGLDLWLDPDYHGEGADLLLRQPIDDTHDAFLVPTGGKLGTLLVTVELGKKSDPDVFGPSPLTLSVWSPDDLTAPIQVIQSETNGVFHHSRVVDANFDGHMDFGYMYAMGNQPCYSHYWIWNEERGQFVAEPEFDQISCPVFDPETGIIDGYVRGGAAGLAATHTLHRWIDGKLVCVRKITTEPRWTDGSEDQAVLMVEEPADGTLTEVFRKTADGTDILDEVVRWLDLSYHGEA